MKNRKFTSLLTAIIALIAVLLAGCSRQINDTASLPESQNSHLANQSRDFSPADVPEYSGEPYAVVNDGFPYFTEADLTDTSYIALGDLDALGRCTPATACLGPDTMPGSDEERGEIGHIKPSGWHMEKYDCVAGRYVVNRAHMIGWQLSGLNDEPRNLITGTRYLNLEMLEFEEMTARYIEQTGNHVMYRVTPVFCGDELMCRGLLLEGYSVEDAGKEICFNLYFYNVQPGIAFSYDTGESYYNGIFLDADSVAVNYDSIPEEDKPSLLKGAGNTGSNGENYILNTNTRKFHRRECKSADSIREENRKKCYTSRDTLIAEGYSPCQRCNP